MSRRFPAYSNIDISKYKKSCINKKCTTKKEEKDLYMEEYNTRNMINQKCYKFASQTPTVKELSNYEKCFDKYAKNSKLNKKIIKKIKCIKTKCGNNLFNNKKKNNSKKNNRKF